MLSIAFLPLQHIGTICPGLVAALASPSNFNVETTPTVNREAYLTPVLIAVRCKVIVRPFLESSLIPASRLSVLKLADESPLAKTLHGIFNIDNDPL